MNLAIIPARGGSKRILKKNIKNFCGKPIISYPISAIKKSNIFNNIIVSTDDEEIKKIALDLGVEVPFMRPEVLSDDFTATVPVVEHAINECEKKGYFFENVCCIYPCSPFFDEKDLKKSFNIFKKNLNKFCFPVVKFPAPILQSLKIKDNNNVSLHFPEYELKRTQDVESTFYDSGQFYWATKNIWKTKSNVLSNGVGFIMPSWRAIDIDTIEDWYRAELIYNSLMK